MEAFQANIAATCPAFGGAAGSLFANAVAAVVAAHCAILSDPWPKDNAEDIISRATEAVSYDFIIVGAGTAGSLLASRLAKLHPSWSVLLVEAGDDPGLESEIPAFVFKNQKSPWDWQYTTHPDEKSCLGFQNNSCVWNKGKCMGGSSSINVMLYIRGHPSDYNTWENSGNPDWGYEELTKYFEIIEKDLKLNNYKYREDPWYDILKNAWKELGFKHDETNSNEARIGTRINKLLTDNGKRHNTAKIYLNNVKNLRIMKNTVVENILIDNETTIAYGIQIRHKSGVVMEIRARKEVILSAGSIATPQILMLSGIGPKKHLEHNGIKFILDLDVGQNLQDHIFLPLFLTTKLETELSSEYTNLMFLHYMMTKSGPLSNLGMTDFMGFINTENLNVPDVQFIHFYVTKSDTFSLPAFLNGAGYKEEIVHAIKKINANSDLLVVLPTLSHPKSKGEVLLNKKDPKGKPIIKANYFQHPDDIKTFIKAIEFIGKLQRTSTFKSLDIELKPFDIIGCPSIDSPNYWECYIRHIATTVYHPVGTTKMGPRSDETSVVNQDLLVHGMMNLRVVDASIMPSIPTSNTMAPTLAIAEKAANIIKQRYDFKEEL